MPSCFKAVILPNEHSIIRRLYRISAHFPDRKASEEGQKKGMKKNRRPTLAFCLENPSPSLLACTE
jgi:hypothetical protein